MAFIAGIIETLLKAVVIGIVAFCGVLFGKRLRDRKTAKEAAEKNE
ncbi:MAG: hypothetical protein HFH53_00470 [Hespellia sp.]|nr:hypothetical protein [Hespellia sp.]